MPEPFLPKDFVLRYEPILGKKENEKFIQFCKTKATKALRVNTLKTTKQELKKTLNAFGVPLHEVPFYDNAFFIGKTKQKLGLLYEHSLGLYYIQDPSSFIPCIALNPWKNDTVIDLAAAPGGKTTFLAELMQNKGRMLALDSNFNRIPSLVHNLRRMGITNTATLIHDASNFKTKIKFDKALLDAPCSTEGFVRHNWNAMSEWSEELILKKSLKQQELILNAFDLLKEGGELVYSTCTSAPEENEAIIHFLLKHRNNALLEKVSIPNFKTREGVTEWRGQKYFSQVKKCLRVWPQDNDSEAFFVAKIKKVK
ncbi:MAG: RsmB/NOP family class I SAM-dependent RNA methyltransferase [archaeon]|nr:RsmB/NOP family class I SAM-dependent RNA methyltransferase [archaeon]